MLPIRTILFPTDFSERSRCAFPVACALARDYGARLLVVHATMPPVIVYGEGFVPVDAVKYEEEARGKLDQIEADPRVPVERRLVEGDPVTEILRVARETPCELIVMGTHGWTGLARFLMGSVA